ncbi:MAG: hypothetical protein EP329_03560 [Deltaproteobacteria bacterium]|nr:MAG: hypothetical protein EP329_03560 [Deltaproteobacteria bacterium]
MAAGCPAGWEPFIIDRYVRVAVAEGFAAAQSTPDWFWLNFFAGPGTDLAAPVEDQIGWVDGTGPGTWYYSDFVDAGATALPNLALTTNNNRDTWDPIPLSRTLGFANRPGPPTNVDYLFNSLEQTLLAPVVCALPITVTGALTTADPGTWDDGTLATTCEGYRRPGAAYAAATTSGVYTIDPDGVGVGADPFDAYCDMTTDGGGWTLLISYQSTSTPYADVASWPDTFTRSGGVPDATGLYKGSLAAFSEIREEVNSGANVAWARGLSEADLELIRNLYGYNSRMVVAPSYADIPACRNTYAGATDNITTCSAYPANANNTTITGFQVDIHGTTYCWFTRGGGSWSSYQGSARCFSGGDPDGTRWARTWFR